MHPSPEPRLIVGFETSDDAGVFRLTSELALVQTVDFFPPIVDDPFRFGQIAAANAFSDIFAMNADPLTALNLVAFPDDELPLELLGEILAGGAERARAAGATIVGGHSVRGQAILYGMSVTGTVHPGQVLTNAGARPGDILFLTKPLGTGIVATASKADACPQEVLESALASMTQLNVLGRDAIRAAGGVHALTDVTGFALAGHSFEVACASRVTLHIDLDRLPLIPGSEVLATGRFSSRATKTNRAHLGDRCLVVEGANVARVEYAFDAQTSGGLLIAVDPDHAAALSRELIARGAAAAAEIGCVTSQQGEVAVVLRSGPG